MVTLVERYRSWRRRVGAARLAEDFRRRRQLGEPLSLNVWLAEHPGHAIELRQLLRDVRAKERVAATPEGDRRNSVPAPDALQIDDLTILREIGRGAVGRVYRAWQKSQKRHVAVKIMLLGGTAGADERERFKREARASLLLDHPNIVRIFGAGDANGCPYMVMELIPGGKSLRDRLVEDGPLPAQEVAELVIQLARAAGYAHGRGIVHRDIKPSNVLLDGDTPKIGDFGLAHMSGAIGSRLTTDGAMVGTIAYMAPEQIDGLGAPDARSDIYALGATLYEALSGRAPFGGASAANILPQILHVDPRLPSASGVRVPAPLQAICMKCLEKDPKQRYQAAGDLARDLQYYLEGLQVNASLSGWRMRKLGRAASRRAGPALVGAAALLLAGIVAWQVVSRPYEGRLRMLRDLQGRPPAAAPDYPVPFLIRAMDEDDPEARMCALVALCRSTAAEAGAALIRASRDPNERVRFHLAANLGTSPNPAALAACENLLKERRGPVAATAIRTAADGRFASLAPELERLAYETDPVGCRLVFSTLLRLEGMAFATFARDYLRSASPECKRQLLRRLAEGALPPPMGG